MKHKLTSAARKADIIKSVRSVFAQKGLDGATSRELADAAGVSEALLFKHFPTKEALFLAMQRACCNDQDYGLFERLQTLEPSASTLVLLVHFLISRMVRATDPKRQDVATQQRLILRSQAENGDFVRSVQKPLLEGWIPKVVESLQAATKAGEATEGPTGANLGAWLTHHLGATLIYYSLPAKPVVEYGVSQDEIISQTVWFALRGLGMKDAAIRRYYNPKALALLAND